MKDAERWERVQELFHSALELGPDERRSFLDRQSADAPELIDELVAMLEQDASQDSLLDLGVAHVADDVLDEVVSVPEQIGPYRIRRLLGVGGMGVVYLAEREDLESRAAIKFLRDARLSPERRDRFRREERILARLDHPAIARLYDASVLADGTPYFVMEYVDGKPLTEYCRHRGLSLNARLELFVRAAEAVQYAHRQALIHRDIKPSNILAGDDAAGGPPVVKLLDFGIAKLIEEEEGDGPFPATLTGAGPLTPAYASPEQLEGKPVGVGADVHGLGAILYELITGERAFDIDGRTPFETAKTVIEGEREAPSKRVRSLGARASGFAASIDRRSWSDLDALCLTALRRDPERRYGSVEALVRDVRRFLDGEPLEARPDSAAYRLGKLVRRRRNAFAAAGIVAAALIALTAFYTVTLAEARDAALAEAARTERIQRFMLELFEGGDDIAGPAAGLTVAELIERGVREADALERDPETQAALYHTLAQVSLQMGELERAESLLERAHAGRRALLGERHPQVADTLLAQAELKTEQGETEQAEALAHEALEIIEASLPRSDPRRAVAMAAVGKALQVGGEYDEALTWLESAVAQDEARGDSEALELSLGILANTCYYAGDYDRSEEINRRLLDLVATERGERHPGYATVLINLAAIRGREGLREEAEALFRQALEINEGYYGRDHSVTASNLGLLGSILVEQEHFVEGRVLLTEALAVRERVFGPRHYQVATTLNEIGRLDLATGDLDAAEVDFGRVLEIYRGQFGDAHPFTATANSNLATISYRRQDFATAERRMREALAMYEAALSPDHTDVGYATIKLGQLLSGMGSDGDAVVALERGIEILEKQSTPNAAWIQVAQDELAAIAERGPAAKAVPRARH